MVGTIGSHAFDDCTNLTRVWLGDNITAIGEYAFINNKFTWIILPKELKTIGSYAFANCPVSELNIPDGVTSIGSYAFKDWLITKVIVPNSVTSIGSGAFKGCKITEITLPFIGENINSTYTTGVLGHIFGSSNMRGDEYKTSYGCGYTRQYSDYVYYIPECLEKVTITLDTTIPVYAFKNCDLIKEIYLPSNIGFESM